MAVSGRWTCTLLHLESAIRWPGTGGGYDSKGADLLDRRTMYFAVWISQDRDHPRVAVPPFRAIEFYEIGGHDRRDWIREHRLRFARGLHLTVYCLDKRIRHLSRNARLRTHIQNPIKTRWRARVHVYPSGKKKLTPGDSRKPGTRYVTRVLESGKPNVCVCYHFFHTRTNVRTYTRARLFHCAHSNAIPPRGRCLHVSSPIFTAG